jgi:hypothetical protein
MKPKDLNIRLKHLLEIKNLNKKRLEDHQNNLPTIEQIKALRG